MKGLGNCRLILQLFIYSFLIFGLILTASGAGPINEEICRDELAKKMRALIKSDEGEIITQASNIATLKLNYKMLSAGSDKVTLEDHVKDHIKNLKARDRKNLISKVKKLYREYGETKTHREVEKVLVGLTKHNYFPRAKRLSNKESAIVMLAYELIDPDKSEMKINDQDVAITWFMDEVTKKAEKGIQDSAITNRMISSVKVAHTAGVFKQTRALTKDELKDKMKNLDGLLQKKFQNLLTKFKGEFNDCFFLLGGEACLVKNVKNVYQKSLVEITQELKKDSLRASVNGKGPRLKLMKNLTLNLKGSIISKENDLHKSVFKIGSKPTIAPSRFPSKIPKLVDGDRPNTCGGLQYESEIRNVRIHSFDGLRALGMGANGARTGSFADPLNKKVAEKFQSKKKKLGEKIGKNSKLGNAIMKFCPPLVLGPVNFKCYPYVKLFKKSKKSAEAKVCCNDKVDWIPYENKFISFTAGLEAKLYLGLPDWIPFIVGELGILGGVAISYINGGGDTPEGCGEKKCAMNTLKLNAYAGAYLDFGISKDKWGAGGRGRTSASRKADRMPAGIGAELKVSWKPHATVRECTYPGGKSGHPEVTLDSGKGYLNGTIYVGWIYSYDYYRELWKTGKKTTFDLPVF